MSLHHSQVPEDVQKLAKNLRTIDLSDNKIPQLTPWFTSLTNLKNLTINNSKLGIIIFCIYYMNALYITLCYDNEETIHLSKKYYLKQTPLCSVSNKLWMLC